MMKQGNPVPNRYFRLFRRACAGRGSPAALMLCFFLVCFAAPCETVNLADDFAKLLECQYFLRIGIVGDGSVVCVVPHSDFLLHDQEGKILYRGKADTPLRLACTKRDVIPDAFFYEVGVFPDEEKHLADALAKEAKAKLDLNVQMLPDPRKDRTPLPDGLMPPPLPWVVVIGPYATHEKAMQDNQKIGAHYRARIFRAPARRSTAHIEARNAEGKIIAEATAYLGIRPSDPGDLMRGGWVSPTEKDWHEKNKWGSLSVYHGLMEAWANKNGRLTLVNRVFIEDYLYGVVPPEIGNSAPFEMKKVQAVISRSVAIAKMRRSPHITWPYDLCATQHCQVYEGALVEQPETNAAVDATWGQVCVHENHIIEAVFSVSCGGVTANSVDAWGGNSSYLSARLDTLENSPVPDFSKYENAEKWVTSFPDVLCNPNNPAIAFSGKQVFRWSRTYTADDLLQRLKARDYRGIEKITNIRVARRTPSGIVTAVWVDTIPRGAVSITSEHQIRTALGHLPSAFFTLSRSYNQDGHLSRVTFKGAGTGHSVGLCQMGALTLIRMGHDYLSVLKHYYEGIEVYKIYQ